MKKYMFFLLIIFMFPINVFAFTDTSKSSIVMDVDSGRILYQKNAHEKRLIASITKIMTATIAIENYNTRKTLTVGDEVLSMYGTNIYVKKGDEISVKDLIYGLILRSGNDAAMVLANNINEKKLINLMNKKAKEIGMKDTLFGNPHGLDDDEIEEKNYSTAYDMAILSRYSYNKLPLYREIINTKKYTYKTNSKTDIWYNRNKLLSEYKYCIGGKTGYTPKAGKTLVSVAKKNNLTLTAVSLKDPNHYNSQKSLYEYLFDKYKNYKIIDKSTFTLDEEYYKDNLYIKDDYYYPLADNEIDYIETIVKISKLKNYNNGDKVGEIEVKFKDKIVKIIDVYVKKDNKKKKGIFSNLFKR